MKKLGLYVQFSARSSYRQEDGILVKSSPKGDVGVLLQLKDGANTIDVYVALFHGTSKENREVLEVLEKYSLRARLALKSVVSEISKRGLEASLERVANGREDLVREHRLSPDIEESIREAIIGTPSPTISRKRMAKLSRLYADRLDNGSAKMPNLMVKVLKADWSILSLSELATRTAERLIR